jgi:hypothetical protein
MVGLAVAVWIGPLQHLWYGGQGISDIPVYERVYTALSDGQVPYRDFDLEYPPLAAALFWVAGVLPGDYADGFSALMCASLCATVLGVMATARAAGFDRRREALAGAAVALSPLFLGNLVSTRYDLVLAALLSWMLWAAVSGRWRLCWGLLAAATLTKLVPLVLAPVLVLLQRRRRSIRPALRGLGASLLAVAVVMAPFVALSPGGTWGLVSYHLDRPLQIESTGGAYLLGLNVLADVPVRVTTSFGSQGLPGGGPDVIAAISTVLLVSGLAAIAWTLLVLLRRARPPADARLALAAACASIALLLATGKVLSPQFLIWLLPVAFLVDGRYGRAAFGVALAAMAATQVYFPSMYWDLVDLGHGPIGLLVLRDALLVVLVALAWPRPAQAHAPGEMLPRRHEPVSESAAERAVAGRFLSG